MRNFEQLASEGMAVVEHAVFGDRDSCDRDSFLKRQAEVDQLAHLRSSFTPDTKPDDERVEPDFLVDSYWFHLVVNMMTVLNTVQMGLEADHPDWEHTWNICENVFTAGFAIEMVVKLCVLRRRYFEDHSNWLDGSLAVLGMLDCWLIALAGGGADLQSLSVLRLLRLMRLARILKLVRNFKPLVLVIQGVLKAISTTCYVFALLMMILYVFAIFFTEHLGRGSVHLYPGYSADPEVYDEQEFMANYNPYICFGNMPLSMLTLFNMAMMAEWTELIRPVMLKQPLYVPVFVFFALLVAFSVMNVMIGSIVDSVFSESKRIDKAFEQQLKKSKREKLQQIEDLLLSIDTDGNGEIDLKELDDAMSNCPDLKRLIEEINLPSGWNAPEMLDMLDNSGDGLLQKAEFTTSFFRLMESDDFQQLCIMQASLNQVKHAFNKFGKRLHHEMIAMSSHMSAEILSLKTAMCPDSQADPTKEESISEDAFSEPCAEPGEQSCHGQCKRSEDGAVITNDEVPPCTGDICNQLIERIEHITHKELTEILDAAYRVMKESFKKELGTIKPRQEPQLSVPRPECLRIAENCSTKITAKSSSCADPTRRLEGNPYLPTSALDRRVLPDLETPHFLSQTKANVQSEETYLRTEYFHLDVAQGDSDDCAGSDFESVCNSACHVDDLPFGVASFSNDTCMQLPEIHSQKHEGTTDPAALPSGCSLDFLFDSEVAQLGFTVNWLQDGGARVGQVKEAGAAHAVGMVEGDHFVSCNGTPILGKDREEVLDMLKLRPLQLRIVRIDE